MRQTCFRHADWKLAALGWRVDEWSRFRLAKAIGAAFQRSSLILRRAELGFDTGLHVVASRGPSSAKVVGLEARVAQVRPADRPKNGASPVSLAGLVEDWWREAQATGRKRSTYESYRNTVQAFVAFLKHDDATRVAAADVLAFKDHRLSTPSPRTGQMPSAKTVKDSDLAGLKTIFGWAVVNRRLVTNSAEGITIKLGKPQKLRSKGFTDAEAERLLFASLNNQRGQQDTKTAAAKRWISWLCAFTGARVREMAQLRKQDVTLQGDWWVVRITSEAGTVKTNEAREVVLQPQLVEQEFPAFVDAAEHGPLFLRPRLDGSVNGSPQNRLAEFARETVRDQNVAPNHGWRHRFKTVGMEAGIDSRILNAIQGQAARSVAGTYGDVTLRTVAAAIERLPRYEVTRCRQPSINSHPSLSGGDL